MNYAIEIYDTWNRRAAILHEVPYLEVIRRQCDGGNSISGIIPGDLDALGPNCRVRVLMDGELFCEAALRRVEAQWGDNKKLILERYLSFHEVLEIDAQRGADFYNSDAAQTYANRGVCDIARDLINRAPGALHYTVAHAAYPDGAEREWDKFSARATPENELESGGISAGDWADATRIDASGAYALDGNTITGIEVDGAAWPDIRLAFIACEELELNDAARARHPETADWDESQYDASAYKLDADAATNALQNLLDTKGISHIELNPQRGGDGAYNGRVDAGGRYVALVFGGGECLNAALLELGHGEVALGADDIPFAPELAPKDFHSYAGVNANSITAPNVNISTFDAQGGVLHSLAALAYFSPQIALHIDAHGVIHLRNPEDDARVIFYQPEEMGVSWGTAAENLCNVLNFSGNPLDAAPHKTYERPESISEYGALAAEFPFFSLAHTSDADRMAENLLDDLAYPEVVGVLRYFNGNAEIKIGDLLEVRGAPLRRVSRTLENEWGAHYPDRLVGLVREIRHILTGAKVQTEIRITSPQRCVGAPLNYILRGQHSLRSIYAFRLDDSAVSLDTSFQLS